MTTANHALQRTRPSRSGRNSSVPLAGSLSLGCSKEHRHVIDQDAVSLFEDLNPRYPMAAAGLIDDLCYRLSALLENEIRNEYAIANACETLAQIFQPMDRQQFPDSHPWDAAYARLGRWLMRGLPQYRHSVIAITGWSNEQMAVCKSRYTEMVRICRDDWNRAANLLENPIIE